MRTIALLAITPVLLLAQAAESLNPAEIETFRPYQLDTCPVSGEKLGSMGEGVSFVHKGQEITLCCKGCLKTFAKQPEKYLQEIKAKEQGGATMQDHQGHQH